MRDVAVRARELAEAYREPAGSMFLACSDEIDSLRREVAALKGELPPEGPRQQRIRLANENARLKDENADLRASSSKELTYTNLLDINEKLHQEVAAMQGVVEAAQAVAKTPGYGTESGSCWINKERDMIAALKALAEARRT